jgi:carbonic anhydrase/acetyltransferase-like protein (isoleucine patch superfamily)
MVLGVPGRVVRALSDEEMQSIRTAAEHYVEYGAKYKVTRNE